MSTIYIYYQFFDNEFLCIYIYILFIKSYKNISIENFIDIKVGNVKLYKSKKRLELRLSKDIINNIINNICSIKLF